MHQHTWSWKIVFFLITSAFLGGVLVFTRHAQGDDNVPNSVYEDFACVTASSAVDNGNGTATITCTGGQADEFVAGKTDLLISGATGDWAGLNTQATANSPFSITTTTTQFLLNDTHRLTMNATNAGLVGRIKWDSEIMTVISIDQNNVVTVTRGTDGTTAAAHTGPNQYVTMNAKNPSFYLVKTTPTASTFTVSFNCAQSAGHACGPLTGNLEIRRYADFGNSLTATVYAADGAEAWGIWDQWEPGGVMMEVPSCPDQTNLYQCVHGVGLPENQKGYVAARGTITNIVVDASHNAVINLSSPWVNDVAHVGLGPMGINSFVFVRGMNEPSFQSMNWMFSTTGCNGTVGGSCSGPITSVTVSMPNVPPGTYLPAAGQNPYLIQPFAARLYAELYVSGPKGNYPSQMLHTFNKSGTWDPETNRLCTYMTPSLTTNLSSVLSDLSFQWGTYATIDNGSGGAIGHFYHNMSFDTEANQPILACANADPSQAVGDFGNDWPNDPAFQGVQLGAPKADPGTGVHYWDGMPLVYMNGFYQMGSVFMSPVTWSTAIGEPEELIKGRAMYYSATNKTYNIYLQTPKTLVTTSYEFRYSTTGSLKTAGFNTGICSSNGTTTCGPGDWATSPHSTNPQVKFTSGVINNPPATIWWAIKPFNTTIFSTTGNGQNPTYVITYDDLGFSVGDHVTVASVSGNTAANVSNQPLTDVRHRIFWYLEDPSSGYTTPGQLTNIICDGTSCTVNLTVAPNIYPGWVVSVYGTTSGGPWVNTYESFYKVTSVGVGCASGTNCFTFLSNAKVGTYNADDSTADRMSVMSLPAVGFAAAGNGNYNSDNTSYNVGGVITSDENNKNFAELVFSPGSAPVVTPPPPPPSDTTPTSVPTGLTVTTKTTSTVSLSWNASTDNVGVMGYKVYRNESQVGTPSGTTFTDTGLTASTTYSYTVSAYDAAGNNSSQSTALNVTTQAAAAPPDTTPPTTSIVSPLNNATVSSTITVTASASDNVGVTKVNLFVDGLAVATDTASPYNFSLDTTSLSNGTHILSVKAYDAAGNIGTSPNVSVTVSNIAQTLTASLSASLSSGIAPLTINLTATAGGTAQGTLNYVFYCNRSDTGTNITSPSDLSISAVTSTSYTASNICSYQTASTYTAKVIIERGSAAPAQAQKTISVSAPVVIPTSTTPTGFEITSVVVSPITDTTANITVTMNQPASAVVHYGPTTSYGQTTLASPNLSTIFFNLTNLTQSTPYDFDVVATPQGTSTPVVSQNYVFTTEATPQPAPQPSPVSSGGGSSGGGGGGGSVSFSTPMPVATTTFTTTLSLGSTGSEVLTLNTTLENLGFLPTSTVPTATFTTATQHALFLFQGTHILPESGELDPSSIALLNKVVAADPSLVRNATGTPAAPTVPAGGSIVYFSRTLSYGNTGSDITLLQTVLKNLGFFNATTTITSYFGTFTEHGMILFQNAHDLNKSGELDLQSQDLMNKVVDADPELTGKVATSTPQAAPTSATVPPVTGSFTNNLTPGSSGTEVTLLQQTLFADGDYPQDLVTGYYGSLTERAVEAFQQKYGIVSYGSPATTGYGAVGPRTRGKLNAILGS